MAIRIPVPQTVETQRVPGFFTAPAVAAPTNPGAVQTARLGQALQQSGAQIARAATDLKDRLDYAGAKRGQALANEYVSDAVREFENLEGAKASPEALNGIWDRLSRKVAEIGNGLENEVQTGLYTNSMQGRMLSARQAVEGHLDQQSRIATVGATSAALNGKLESVFESGTAFAHAPTGNQAMQDSYRAAWEEQVESARAEALVMADLQGMGPEETEAFVQQKLTEAHWNVTKQLVDEGQTTKARGYAEMVSGDLTPTARAAFENLLRTGSLQEEAANIVTAFIDEADQEVEDLLALSDATTPPEISAARMVDLGRVHIRELSETGQITIEERDAALKELERRGRERRDREITRREDVRRRAEAQMRGTDRSVEDLPPSLQQEIEANDLGNDMNNYEGSKAQYGNNRSLVLQLYLPDGGGLYTLSKAEFLTRVSGQLDDRHLGMAEARYDAFNRLANQQPEAARTVQWSEMVREAARGEGIYPLSAEELADLPPEQTNRFYQFELRADEALNNWTRTNLQGQKRGATTEEMQEVLNTMLKNRVRFAGLGPTVAISGVPEELLPVTTVSRDQMISAYRAYVPGEAVPDSLALFEGWNGSLFLRQIPEQTRASIIRKLNGLNIPVTEVTIGMMFLGAAGEQTPEDEENARTQQTLRDFDEGTPPPTPLLPPLRREGR